MLAVSSGVHLTLDRSFLPGEHALMIPRTHDGRVLFAVPWLDHVILGTTDEPRKAAELEPRPLEREVEFLLEHANEYLAKRVVRADVLSVFTGLRPLVRQGNAAATKSLSRDHVIAVSDGGLVTITGGKWTSYRKMAEDAVTRAAEVGGLTKRDAKTQTLRLHGAPATKAGPASQRFAHFGTDAAALEMLIEREPALGREFHPRLPLCGAEVVWAVSREMARSLDDMLSRRSRALQLDVRVAIEIAEPVATLLARELGHDQAWIKAQVEEFRRIAEGYLPKAKGSSAAKSR
jgi:glycerol-3-phosphate dehydrogenase